jgi:hypothetical protein
MADVSSLRALRGVRELRIHGAHRLADLTSLAELTRLRVLALESVYDAKRFDALAGLTRYTITFDGASVELRDPVEGVSWSRR